jgi:hypothetical protein
MRFRTIVIRAAITAAQDDDDAMILGADDAPRKKWVRAADHRQRSDRPS